MSEGSNIPGASFAEMLISAIGEESAVKVLNALEESPSVSIRLNPLRLKECPFPGAGPVPWSPYGYFLPERPIFTLDPLFHAGCYYVQDSSAMFPCHVLRSILPGSPDFPGLSAGGPAVLDLCAAPGGKTTDAAASLRERFGDDFLLVANEVVRKRFDVLRDNVALWGDPRVAVTSLAPAAIGASGTVFDIILADVPCSGEGMFRKEEKAVEDWSEETVAFCAARQRSIIADVWPALADGGFLIYCTCTFNSFENDDNVEWICSALGAEPIILPDFPPVLRTRFGQALLPGFVRGEGQYVALLRKSSPAAGKTPENPSATPFSGFSAGKTAQNPSAARPLRLSFPAQDAVPEQGPRIDVDRHTALHYLHGDAIVVPDAPKGLITVCYEGHPLGPAKNIGLRCNNLYPKSRRIRIDIPAGL